MERAICGARKRYSLRNIQNPNIRKLKRKLKYRKYRKFYILYIARVRADIYKTCILMLLYIYTIYTSMTIHAYWCKYNYTTIHMYKYVL